MTVSEPSSSMLAPKASPSPLVAVSPSQHMLAVPQNENHHPYHLTLIPGIGIAVTAVAVILLMVLIILIRRKSRELEDPENLDKTSLKPFPPPRSLRKFQEGLFVIPSTVIFPSNAGIILNIYFPGVFWGWWG